MAGVLDSVNQRTQMVGKNRLELLLFRLRGRQIYGINVFKVKEVLQCPKLFSLPNSRPVVRGVAHSRGETIPIIDLSMAIGLPGIPQEELSTSFVIITEYNRKTQGFLVSGVERIMNMNWEEILPPPKGAGKDVYLTAVTKIDDKLIEIIDVEKILSEVSPLGEDVTEAVLSRSADRVPGHLPVLVVDDSAIQEAMQRIWTRMKVLVEPSAAVPLAAVASEGFRELDGLERVAVVLSGGNLDLEQLRQ